MMESTGTNMFLNVLSETETSGELFFGLALFIFHVLPLGIKWLASASDSRLLPRLCSRQRSSGLVGDSTAAEVAGSGSQIAPELRSTRKPSLLAKIPKAYERSSEILLGSVLRHTKSFGRPGTNASPGFRNASPSYSSPGYTALCTSCHKKSRHPAVTECRPFKHSKSRSFIFFSLSCVDPQSSPLSFPGKSRSPVSCPTSWPLWSNLPPEIA